MDNSTDGMNQAAESLLNLNSRETTRPPEAQIQQPPLSTQQPSSQPDINQLIALMTSMMNQNAVLLQNCQSNRPETFHYNVLPDLSHNIDNFTGLEVASEAKTWLSQLESTANLHRWTEAVAFETARAHLKKAAKNWYLSRIDTIQDWRTFRSEFKGTFMMEKSLSEK